MRVRCRQNDAARAVATFVLLIVLLIVIFLLIEACRGWIGRASSKLVEAGSIELRRRSIEPAFPSIAKLCENPSQTGAISSPDRSESAPQGALGALGGQRSAKERQSASPEAPYDLQGATKNALGIPKATPGATKTLKEAPRDRQRTPQRVAGGTKSTRSRSPK